MSAWLKAGITAVVAAFMPVTAPGAAPTGVDLASLDRTVSPCDDFFQFACGGWIASHPIPPDQAVWGTFSELEARTQQQLRKLVEVLPANADADRRRIVDFYAACMNDAEIERRGIAPLQPLLKQIDAMSTQADVARTLATLHRYGVPALFDIYPWPDLDHPDVMIAGMFQSGMSLPDPAYYLQDDAESMKQRTGYRGHVIKMFELLGARTATADADAVLAFETRLAKASMSREEMADPLALRHMTSVTALARRHASFDWLGYIDSVGLARTTRLNLAQPLFMDAVNANVADIKTLKIYLRWQVLDHFAPQLPARFVDEQHAFRGEQLTGTSEQRPRSARCVDQVDGLFPDALGKAFVEAHFSARGKEEVTRMVTAVKQAMIQSVRQLDWLSAPTRERALAKLDAMVGKVGYPDRWRTYDGVEIRRDDALGNEQRARAHRFAADMKQIGGPVDRGIWYMSAPTANAYYQLRANDVNFPAGVLQAPFYYDGGDAAYNFGGIGAIIGHEITHGFDNSGRKFDARGQLVSWWRPADEAEFERRAECIVEQYGAYSPLPGVRLNGRATLTESIADNGGARLGYAAMLAVLTPEQLAPRDGFTARQRYFLGLSQAWCSHATDQLTRMRAQTDTHTPPKFQVNGAISNMPEFRAAFSCPATAPMVRRRACRIW